MQVRSRVKRLHLAIALAALVGVGVIAITIMDIYHHPQRVASILNIPEPPKSLHVIDCATGTITDVLVTCAIEIDPREFPLLLAGYQFAERQAEGTSYSLAPRRVGREFPVVMEYTVEPAAFKHGGHVKVFADQERRRAVVDLYIE